MPKTRAKAMPCVPGALPGGLVRTSFFDGMFLTQADLENEQRYWRQKRRLTNRALGNGVVWGLRASWKPELRRLEIGPGYALDCCGNDLVLETRQNLSERALLDSLDRAHTPLLGEGGKAGVVLQYAECPEDLRPLHRDACTTDITRCETARVRETTRLRLVPPPAPPAATPAGELVAELEALRDSITDVELRDRLFPGHVAPLPTEPVEENHVPVKLYIRLSDDGSEQAMRPGTTDNPTFAPVTFAGDRFTWPALAVHFELRPDPGRAFFRGQVTGNITNGETTVSTETVATITAPLDLALVWSAEIPNEAVPDSNGAVQMTGNFDVDLGIVELFGKDKTAARFIVDYALAITWDAELASYTFEITSFKVSVTEHSTSAMPVVEGGDCFALLGPEMFGVGAGNGSLDTPKAMILGALYAWLANLLRNEGQPPDEWTATGGEHASGHRLVAVWLYLAAWRILFGVNPAADPDEGGRAAIAGLLEKLFDRLCNGLVYPGPRCTDSHHGVYLGSVEIGQNGGILSFDPWEYRRHVITGPLLSHWGRNFGLAPLDVVAGRFFRAICCVSRLNAPVLPGLPNWEWPKQVLEEDPTTPVQRELFGKFGGIVTGDAYVLFGEPDSVTQRLESVGVSIDERRTVGMFDMVGKVIDALGQNGDFDPSVPMVLYTLDLPGPMPLSLLAPARDQEEEPVEEGGGEPLLLEGPMVLAVRRERTSVAPLARDAVYDFATALVSVIPVDNLARVTGDDPAVTAVREKLRAAGVSTVGEMITIGPERTERRVLGADAGPEERHVLDQVFEATDALVAGLVDAAGKATAKASEQPFRRASLTDPKFLREVGKRTAGIELAGEKIFTRALPRDLLAEAAARAAANHPA